MRVVKHAAWHGGSVQDFPRADMDAIVAALRPPAVEIGIYRAYATHCMECGAIGHYHDPGYLAAFLQRHSECRRERE